MTRKQQILDSLTRAYLVDIAGDLGVNGARYMYKKDLVTTLSRMRSVKMDDILIDISLQDLKVICRNLGLDDKGNKKALLVDRLLGRDKKVAVEKKKPIKKHNSKQDTTQKDIKKKSKDAKLKETTAKEKTQPEIMKKAMPPQIPREGMMAVVRNRRAMIAGVQPFDADEAARQAEQETTALMREVFELRAHRVAAIKRAGRLSWIRETGTRARMIDSVERTLLPVRESWDDMESPTDPQLVDALLKWAWPLVDMQEAVAEAYRGNPPSRLDFARVLGAWIGGQPLVEIAQVAHVDIDTMLGIHSRVISYVLQVAVEQGIGLLNKLLEEGEGEISQAVVDFPDYLRFGVPTPAARVLAVSGVRHRRAAVVLGQSPELVSVTSDDRDRILSTARQLLEVQERWLPEMGRLVLDQTIHDLNT